MYAFSSMAYHMRKHVECFTVTCMGSFFALSDKREHNAHWWIEHMLLNNNNPPTLYHQYNVQCFLTFCSLIAMFYPDRKVHVHTSFKLCACYWDFRQRHSNTTACMSGLVEAKSKHTPENYLDSRKSLTIQVQTCRLRCWGGEFGMWEILRHCAANSTRDDDVELVFRSVLFSK